MTREEKIADALARNDYYELAKITMEERPMKIDIKQIKSEETLQRFGNKFFTNEQVKEIRNA